MSLTPGRTSSRDLRTLFQFGTLGGLTDGQLMERFATLRDEGAELAFAALVERHGPMVLRVCRGILRDDHEAMDAFQATFLVLARKGHALWVRDSLGPWLHRVACRAARQAKAQEGRRRALERRAAESLGGGSDMDDRDDLAAILHEELDRLPDRYRVPIVLCDLEGRTCEEVAQHLGRPVGTIKSWRARGRERLRDRLARRGLAGFPAVPFPSLTSPLPNLPCSTLDAVVGIAAGWRVAGVVPATVLALTEGVLSSMLAIKLKAIAAAVLAAGAVAGSAGVFAYQPLTSESDGPEPGARIGILESKSVAAGPVQTIPKPYFVGDLLPSKPKGASGSVPVDMGPIIELITSSVAPGTWTIRNETGQVVRAADHGPGAVGSITPFPLSVSLIVRNTAEVQDQVGNCLRLIRRFQELAQPTEAREDPHQPPKDAPPPTTAKGPVREIWPMTLRDAIRIGLDNFKTARILSGLGVPAGEIVISPVSPGEDKGGWMFKGKIMAHVRSIEQRYWSLAQRQVELGSIETAVSLGEEILKREQTRLEDGRSNRADVAEARQRLEQFRLDFVTRASDVITAERQLRNIIGLPPADNRRIVPGTAPIEAKMEPNWEVCLAEMHQKQPDIARQKEVVKSVEEKPGDAGRDVALRFLPNLGNLGSLTSSATKDRLTRAEIQRQKASLDEIVHQTTHSLARSFVEVDANYKQFKTASRLRAAAAQQHEAQKAFYEEGRITKDRYLDEVAQFTYAVAREAQFKASYNISLVALEEAKGTLLEHDKIAVAEVSRSVPGHPRDDRAKTASFEEVPTMPLAHPTAKQETDTGEGKAGIPTVEIPHLEAEGKTVSFQLTIGAGSRPLEIRGSFTVAPNKPADADPAKKP